MRLDIQGIGWVTSSGIGSGRTGGPFELASGKLPVLRSRLFLPESHKRFGRFDLYTKAGFAAISLALQSAGLDRWQRKQPVGLVLSTRRGSLEMDARYFKTAASDGGAFASPNLFAYTLSSCVLGEASIQFGLTGPAFVTDDSGAGHLNGIHAALDMIRWDFCRTMVGGWCDVGSRLLRAESSEPCGAVFFVLSRGGDTSAWQWDGVRLTHGPHPVNDIAELADAVLAAGVRD